MQLLSARARRVLRWCAILALPYAALVIIWITNPFLVTAKHCPLPTFFEQDFGIFPSPISGWFFYVIALPFLELVLFPVWLSISGIVMGLVSMFRPERWPAAWRRIFIALPITIYLVGSIMLVALYYIFEELDMYYAIKDLLGILLFAVMALSMFGSVIWLLVAGILERRSKDEVVRTYGKTKIIASVLWMFGGFALVALWGIVAILNDVSGVDTSISAGGGGGVYASPVIGNSLSVPKMTREMADTIGFSVGGAKDADNFRENIKNCYLPIPTDITYEGLFYDYSFNTQNKTSCTGLFCPQYEGAVVPDPFNKKDEYFLSIGLASNIRTEDFVRPPLDVVVVLDISGSMSSAFDRYYYDQFAATGAQKADPQDDWNTSKMEIAKEAVGAMVDRLHPDDRFGMVVFDNTAEMLLDVDTMGENGYARAKNAIALLQPRGGTNMEAGLEEGTRLIQSLKQDDEVDRERRIIFLTDAMPNTGAIEQNELYQIGMHNTEEGIHTTFIGVGVDFNTELVEALTKKIRGANYYSIHSSTDFEKRLDTEFEYMVAPLVYDLALTLEGGDYEIRTVYGSPEAHLATGEMLRVSSLFPSPTTEGNSRGGVMLAHLKKVGNSGTPTRIVASYEDRAGEVHQEVGEVNWGALTGSQASQNVRKAVLLSRYVNLMQNWLIDENERLGRHEKTVFLPIQPSMYYTDGLPVPYERYAQKNSAMYVPYELGRWERLSRSLQVSTEYKNLFKDFREYAESEMQAVDERDLLQREINILRDLENSPDASVVEQ